MDHFRHTGLGKQQQNHQCLARSLQTDRQAHTPSIAFRHLPPKEGCRKPVAWSVRRAQTPSTGLRHPPWRKVPEGDARSVRQAQTPSTGLRHPSFKALSTDEWVFSQPHSGAVAGDRWSGREDPQKLLH